MLNLRTDIPLKSEVIDEVNSIHAQIRDLLIEQEQMLALAVDRKVLLTKDEVSAKLRCPPDKIPKKIPRIRIGRQYLFQLGDVEDFIDSKRKVVY